MVNGFQYLKTMKRISTIDYFFAKDENGDIIPRLKVGNEVKFHPRPMKKRICFIKNNKEVCFDLIFYKSEEIKRFQLRENKYFDKDYIKKLSKEFSFDLVSDPIHSEYYRGILSNIEFLYSLPLMGVLRKVEKQYFLMIFAERGSTNFENDIVYVHGIWEVELPKKIEDELFNNANKSV